MLLYPKSLDATFLFSFFSAFTALFTWMPSHSYIVFTIAMHILKVKIWAHTAILKCNFLASEIGWENGYMKCTSFVLVVQQNEKDACVFLPRLSHCWWLRQWYHYHSVAHVFLGLKFNFFSKTKSKSWKNNERKLFACIFCLCSLMCRNFCFCCRCCYFRSPIIFHIWYTLKMLEILFIFGFCSW